jgi:hypothetical protein
MAFETCFRKGFHFHRAEISKHGKVIAESRNRVGSRARGCGWGDQTIHAERAVVKDLGDTSRLRGCVLKVVRITPDGRIANSKPCESCIKFLEKCIRKYGLLKVLYSNERGSESSYNISNGHCHCR